MTSQVPVGQPAEGTNAGGDLWDSFMQRGIEKCKQQPLVPLGAAITVWSLLGAVREFKRGNSQNVNRYLRFRVVAQGATVAAMLIGSVIYEKSVREAKEAEEKAANPTALGGGEQPVPAPVVEAASQPPPLTAPTPASTVLPVAEPGPVEGAVENKPKQTRYVGSNDQWREYFDRKNAERAAAATGEPAPPPATMPPEPQQQQPSEKSSSGGWFSWRK